MKIFIREIYRNKDMLEACMWPMISQFINKSKTVT